MPRKSKTEVIDIAIVEEPKSKDLLINGKKAVRVRKNNKRIPPENISEEGALRIEPLGLMSLLRLEAELRAARSNLQNKHLSFMELRKQVDPKGLLSAAQAEIAAHELKLKEFQEQYDAKKAEIEKRLNIDLKKVSYDDTSGIIFDDPNPAEDAKALKKT